MVIDLKNVRKYLTALYLILSTAITTVTLNRILLILTLGICGLTCLINKEFHFKKSSYFKFLALYGAMLLFSASYTVVSLEKITTVLISYSALLVFIYFLILNIDNEKDVNFYINTIIMASVVCCIYTLYSIGLDDIKLLGESRTAFRLAGEEQNSNSIGMLSAFGSVFSFYFVNFENIKVRNRMLYTIILVFTFAFSLLTGSRKALLMLAIGYSMIIYHKNALGGNAIKFFFKMLASIVAVIILVYYIDASGKFTIIAERLEGLLAGLTKNSSNIDNSTEARFDMIVTGFKVFMTAPFKGQGINASYRYFLTYSHNNYIEILMNTGIIGLFLFYKPIVSSFVSLLKLERGAREPVYIAALFVFIWLFVGAWGLVFYYSKIEMSVLTIFVCWINIKKGENNVEEIDQRI